MAKRKQKYSEEEKKQWDELFTYIEKQIFNYDDNQKLQKNAVLRLKGLSRGQTVASNNVEEHGKYGPDILLIAFKINRNNIVPYLNKKDFDSEEHKMAYCCACVRDKLNSVYEKVQRAKKMKQQEQNIDTSIIENEGVEYTMKNNIKKAKVHKELW